MGFLVFENKLKDDSAETIELLREGGIDSRMITGDNIYIAIETAMRCNILRRGEEVSVIEGKEQKLEPSRSVVEQILRIKQFSFQDQKVIVS